MIASAASSINTRRSHDVDDIFDTHSISQVLAERVAVWPHMRADIPYGTIHIRPPYSGIAKRVWHLRVLVTCSPTKYMIVVSASGKLITKLRCLLLRLVGELWWINMTRFATI
jgi:hypothetical protein